MPVAVACELCLTVEHVSSHATADYPAGWTFLSGKRMHWMICEACTRAAMLHWASRGSPTAAMWVERNPVSQAAQKFCDTCGCGLHLFPHTDGKPCKPSTG